MKYFIWTIVLMSLVCAGCTVTRQVEGPPEPVELLSMAPLPPLTSLSTVGGTKLNLLLHVRQDGSVEEVRMLGSSVYALWDSLALQSIRQWRFAAPKRNGVATDLWFRQLVIVQVQDPIVMTLGELVSADSREADSLYALLKGGANLDSLFKQRLGRVDVALQPQHVRDALRTLKEQDFTAPLRVGERYVLYKRF